MLSVPSRAGGHGAGKFYHIHSIATDSKGNVYLDESFERRAIRWVLQGHGIFREHGDVPLTF